jgi:hypothetical protein
VGALITNDRRRHPSSSAIHTAHSIGATPDVFAALLHSIHDRYGIGIMALDCPTFHDQDFREITLLVDPETMIVGMYADPEIKVLSVFREVGHFLALQQHVIPFAADIDAGGELVSWMLGFEQAKNWYHILWSPVAMRWAGQHIAYSETKE